ncbi:dipeptide epimerase [Vibrio sp. SCSIO 43133]|uniref:enolase C-terminal domain-like protein n=1 Tax=Vibrio sp. SCSIO 43133 TaxID=2802577 RepID=UPI0020761C46|nr:enolase C-terminal domain-like protein [Vibrio sp. SCSIO 43133]USE01414.1 dipeptide epimerase [Vibrio sp. SCSIO 43133]
MKIEAHHHSIKLAKPFTISRGTRTHCEVVRVSIEYQGQLGQGECMPYPRYGESVESVMAQINEFSADLVTQDPFEARLALQNYPAGAARNAIDCALWSLESQLSDSQFPSPYFAIAPSIETAMTVSVADLNTMTSQAKQYIDEGATLLKVKLDNGDIVEKIAAIRALSSEVKIVIDANEAWASLDLESLFDQLAPLDITMIEQPVPSGQDDLLKGIPHPIPLCADESCHTRAELDELVDCYEMINIKLDKTGGLTEALALEGRARELGLMVMSGCMLGTSMAMKAALPIATKAEVVDLDGPVLLGSDVENGLSYKNGRLLL